MSRSGSRGARERPSGKLDDARKPLIGALVEGRFRVLSHIGSGGMADVYRVEHTLLGRHLAMKVLRHTQLSNPALVRRFAREARAASRLRSEHVVSIHDYGELPDGFPYFVMELLEGQTLREVLLGSRTLPPGRVANIAIDVCLGLHVAHRAGLVHRDLKPENLWLANGDDGRERCILLDFGVARFEGTHSTGDGVLVGTARYMSPEQIAGERAPGPASDLFSLAVILHECLTGECPFVADSLERTLFRVLRDTPKPVHELAPDLPPELSRVLERALSKEPEQRFDSALSFAASLRPFAAGPRPLPPLGAAVSVVATDSTLAEADTSHGSEEHAEPVQASAAPARRVPAPAVAAFTLGLLLGGAGLWLTLARRAESTGEQTQPSTPSSLGAAAASAALAASSREAPAPIASIPAALSPAPSPTPPRRELSRAPARDLPARAASVRESPGRPAPPHPDFDGRNPYLQ